MHTTFFPVSKGQTGVLNGSIEFFKETLSPSQTIEFWHMGLNLRNLEEHTKYLLPSQRSENAVFEQTTFPDEF